MISKLPRRMIVQFPSRAGVALLLAIAMACGGGGSNVSSTGPVVKPLSLTAPASLSLPIPSTVHNDSTHNAAPYVGTVTVTLTKTAAVTGAVALSVTGMPANVKADFAQASTTGSSDELTIQAGYPDPTDPTFIKQLYPALGSYPLTITATSSGVSNAVATLTLNVVKETPDFNLSAFTADGSAVPYVSTLSLVGSTSLVMNFSPYLTNGTNFTGSNLATVAVKGLPAGLAATLDQTGLTQTNLTLGYIHSLTFTAQTGLAAGTYGFEITATYNGTVRTLPVIIAYSPAPFYIQPPFPASGPSVAQGGTITFPLYLGHDDAYFGTVQPTSGMDPTYVGGTQLAVAGTLPAGLTVAFGTSNPTGLASTPLTVTAASSLSPGVYPVTLQAARTYAAAASVISTYTLPVNVTANTLSSVPTLWIQGVEWGQTVLKPNLPLVAGKAALLRVQLMADQPNQPVPASFKATVNGTDYPLLGPAKVPTQVVEGDLPSATSPSGSTYTALLPATAVTSGMTAVISGGGLASVTITPVVLAGSTLQLTVVPIIHEGLAPTLPADTTMTQELEAFWPLQSVKITHRAPYTTATVIPTPPTTKSTATDYSTDGWGQVLSELASLQIVDGSNQYYYGFLNLNLPASWNGSSVVGLSYIGQGVGFGVDETTAALFDNTDPGLDNAAVIMVHEEGHAFNLFHAPAGGAGQPQLDYPYAGADIGSWGFDPVAMAKYDPAANFDIMSYAAKTHWVSDWDYLAAMGWVGTSQANGETLAYRAAASDQWVVSGWVDPSGDVHLQPLVRTACASKPPQTGEYHLKVQTSQGQVDVPFAAVQVPDLPEGHRHFSFTVPASGEVSALEVHHAGARVFRKANVPALADRRQALEAGAKAGDLVVREAEGSLHLEWDASAHPWVSVIHEGAHRTTLALHLTGGKADLPLDGLPSGGRFLVHYSDGLNAVVRATER